MWWDRENLATSLALLLLTALAWAHTLRDASVHGMPMSGSGSSGAGPLEVTGIFEVLLFLTGWAVMMVAMMLPAVVPLVLLYRTTARRRLSSWRALGGTVALLAGYTAVWTLAGLPIYGYQLLSPASVPGLAVPPSLLLIAGGIYQFTAVKASCHTRCSSPLFFLMREWRPGMRGAARMGVRHGVDCLGCCAGLMLALVALGMMELAWMLTAATLIFVEKTLPGGHHVARPLGVALVLGGMLLLASALLGGRAVM